MMLLKSQSNQATFGGAVFFHSEHYDPLQKNITELY